MVMKTEKKTLEAVRDYYGNILKTNNDLKTSACCTTSSLPTRIRDILKEIHPEVIEKFYGCGSPIPPELTGRTVLDLGSGSGFHTDKFGYKTTNVEFLKGYIEDLVNLNIANSSIDVIVSNCVINLSPDKNRVFSEIFRVLKPGGELYFADVFSGRRIPKHLSEDPVLLGECLGGALYIEDFRRTLAHVGCHDYRVVAKSKIELHNTEIEHKAGMIDFYSMTIRAFKLDLEDRCEDYGQVAYYLGTIPECRHFFTLDDHHLFKTGQPLLVCKNTASMLSATRYAPHFKIIGEVNQHLGLFDCGSSEASGNFSGACC
ncbi:MAG: methyltransferase domain-containing protein [Deltaproteobacteria bacterium]|nr:methyltransferase domain-containing protein [Deltaproteobacteria bacterium]